MNPLHRFPLVAAAVLIGALLTVACTTPTPTPPPPSPTPDATSTPTVATSTPTVATPSPSLNIPTPVPLSEARILTIASPAAPPHYDVQQTLSPSLHRTGPGLVYSRLLRFRTDVEGENFTLQLECDLCESWQQTDPVTYRFALRHGVRWQNLPPVNGRELTADDIIYSYKRQTTPGWENAPLLRDLQSFAKVDAYTLEIKARGPDADFLMALADGHSKIVAREAVEAKGDLRVGPPVGSGPWQWVEATPGVTYDLERNPGYYEPGLPEADRLSIHVIPGLETRLTALLVGNLDLADVPPSRASSLLKEYPDLGLLQVPHYGQGTELVINAGTLPLQKLEVRQAIFLALDPWRYARESSEGGVFTGLGLPLVSREWLLPEEELKPYWGDPQKAAALLKQAGVRPAVVLTVADYGDFSLALANSIARDLQAVGINVDQRILNPVEYADLVWQKGQFGLSLGPLPPMSTPNDYLLGVLHSKGSANFTRYQDPDLDRLLDTQATTRDPVARLSLIRDVQRRALGNAVRFTVATQTSYWAWQPRVTGFHPNLAGYEYFYLARISVPKPGG